MHNHGVQEDWPSSQCFGGVFLRSHTSLWQTTVAGTRSAGQLDPNHSNLKCFEGRHATHSFGGRVPALAKTVAFKIAPFFAQHGTGPRVCVAEA